MSDFEVLPIGTKQRLEQLETHVATVVEHLSEHITFAKDRIQDGIEGGAAIWRIALEDVAGENALLLAKLGHPHHQEKPAS